MSIKRDNKRSVFLELISDLRFYLKTNNNAISTVCAGTYLSRKPNYTSFQIIHLSYKHKPFQL